MYLTTFSSDNTHDSNVHSVQPINYVVHANTNIPISTVKPNLTIDSPYNRLDTLNVESRYCSSFRKISNLNNKISIDFQNHRILPTNTPATENDPQQTITIPYKILRFGRNPAVVALQRKLLPLERSASRIQATKPLTKTSTTPMLELPRLPEVEKWCIERQPMRTTGAITPSSRLGLRRRNQDISREITRSSRTWRPR